LIATVHGLLAGLLDAPLAVLDRFAPTAGLWLLSGLSGVVVLVVFRWTSNPAAIRAARRNTQAHLLAVRLYREDLVVVFRSQARFLVGLGRYLARMLPPFAALLLPLALLCAHLDARYGCRALRPGERAIVTVRASPAVIAAATLDAPEGVQVEAGPVRIQSRGEIDWRILARSPGSHRLTVQSGGRGIDKQVRVSTATEGASPRRMVASLWSLFLAPAEAPIDGADGVDRIEIAYPAREVSLLGWKTHWLVVFLAASTATAISLRRRLGVEF
jgi:hypothetical protein